MVSIRYSPENEQMSPENQWLEELLILTSGHSAQPIGTEKIDSVLAKVPVHGTVTAAFPMAVFCSAENSPQSCVGIWSWSWLVWVMIVSSSFKKSRFKSFKHLLLYQTIHEVHHVSPRCSKNKFVQSSPYVHKFPKCIGSKSFHSAQLPTEFTTLKFNKIETPTTIIHLLGSRGSTCLFFSADHFLFGI